MMSKFNFNIDLDDNLDLDKPELSKSKLNVISLKENIIITPIVKAFKNKNLDTLNNIQRKYLYSHFEDFRQYQYLVEDEDELKEIIIKNSNNDADLNWIDTSNVIDMSSMFKYSYFTGDISNWDVSHVEDMGHMFAYSNFNGNISKWNISNVKGMLCMFYNSQFNGDISKWNVSNVIIMRYMFEDSIFNGNISGWNINPKCNTNDMFKNCPIKEEYKPKNYRNE